MKDAKYFNYLNQSSCFELNGVDNAKEYERTVQAMDVIGIDATERRNILSVLAGILHLGNVKFIDAADSDDDGCVLDGDNAKNALLDCAAVLKVDAGNLEQSLCSRRIVLADEVIHKSLSAATASHSRDALAKSLYSKLFDLLVDRVNASIGQDELQVVHRRARYIWVREFCC